MAAQPRKTIEKVAARDGEKRQRYGQDAKRRRQTSRPFVAKAGNFEGSGHQPVDQRRLAVVRFAPDLRDKVIPGLEHRDRRKNAPAFLSLDLERTEARQVNGGPAEKNESDRRRP